jgi:hypothetical protein
MLIRVLAKVKSEMDLVKKLFNSLTYQLKGRELLGVWEPVGRLCTLSTKDAIYQENESFHYEKNIALISKIVGNPLLKEYIL